MEVWLERAARAGSDDPAHPRLAHRPEVGAEVDPVRGELVLVAMPRHEGDLLALDRADADRGGRRPERRVQAHLLHVIEELVEARAAEDANHGAVSTAE